MDHKRAGPSNVSPEASNPAWLKWTAIGIGAGAAAASILAGTTSGLAAYFARQVITPPRTREETIEILAVMGQGQDRRIILRADSDTTVDGTYSLMFDDGSGHARIGEILSYVPGEGTVEREVDQVYSGDISTAVRGWWSGSVYDSPTALGYAEEEVDIAVEGGHAPAWIIRAGAESGTWAIMVHGRGARRSEGLRAVPTAAGLDMTSLLISYRNDGEAPDSADGRYGLGMTEWHDVEAAITYALAHGAKDVVLFGWSMGGAVCLQAVDLSQYARHIRALVLDGPVINWIDVLAHHARLNKIPTAIGRFSQWLISNPGGRKITGLATPVDLKSLDWVSRADHLRQHTLIIHSEDDEFVPVGPSAELAAKNPQMVTFVRFTKARHTKEWNVSPQRWESEVRAWLLYQLRERQFPGDHDDGV
ncbi:alpha/beta hydrolase family protein [Arthrobacter roseus]|uniref:alpha/beta hydrolase family protein n=1 Tax=Arthrobacter roseus TaxID=136274 RepID=UPI001965AA58|nr:alpha/beta fold hydrolase [Arthrobacter roseus]MBM7848406.1 pimeloyl-ACP methyl ester carboxylesterase [Arthrobacter roseus]